MPKMSRSAVSAANSPQRPCTPGIGLDRLFHYAGSRESTDYLALRDGSFARRHVTLGYRDSQNYNVTSGLTSGDRIVSNGALFLQFMQSQ